MSEDHLKSPHEWFSAEVTKCVLKECLWLAGAILKAS